MKISFITIGTEITTGEIENSNVQWLAQKVDALGHDVVHHLSVPDNKEVITSALNYLSTSDALILTGGLGPTQDDLTRFVVADWLRVPLEFHEGAWQELTELLKGRERVPSESHKTQCYFPKGSRLLSNAVGSAQGFVCEKEKQKIFVLPGPPREMKPMWENEVEPSLPKGPLTPWVRWIIEGVPESEVAARFERLLKKEGVNPKDLEIGYRASLPLIHVKLREAHVPSDFHGKMKEEFGDKLKD